jgi:DNA-directed RNA polymerase subunit beta'
MKEKKLKQEGKGKKGKNPSRALKSSIQDLKTSRNEAKEEVLSIKPLNILSEVEYRDFSLKYGEAFEAGTGAETLRLIFAGVDMENEIQKLEKELEEMSTLKSKKALRRLKLFKVMMKAELRPEWMFMTVLPILPPGLRPMVQLDGGRYASSDLNDLYRRVINRNNRLKYLLEIGAPEVIIRNEKRMLQEAVDSLIDNGMRRGTTTRATTGGRRLLKSLADILKGKQGRFRQNLLGKRVDYSGRSVIVVGPELKFNQVGIPKKMALELFKPFVIKKLLDKELAYNVRGASRLIDEETDEVWQYLEEVVKEKLVLLNRAPTLHRLGIQAFYPILIGGEAMRIHPMVCNAFNADFDGDQMAVHVPLSELSQKEARDRMLSSLNVLKPSTGTPIITIYQDIVLGCYWLTNIWEEEVVAAEKVFAGPDEAVLAHELGKIGIKTKIKVRKSSLEKEIKGKTKKDSDEPKFIETSVGRILFNEALPEDFPFENKVIKLKDLKKILGNIIKSYPKEIVDEILDNVKDLGFEYSTLSGITWGVDDLIVPKEKKEIMELARKEEEKVEDYFKKGLLSEEERSMKIISIWSRVKIEIEKKVRNVIDKKGSVFQMLDAGAKGSWTQAVQMCGMKGLVTSPTGEIIELPVKSSYKEGFTVLEYFISTHGARKGTADKALRTSSAGYLTRRLVDVAHEIIVSEPDCKDKLGIEVFRKDSDEVDQDFLFKITGRISLEDIRGVCKKGDIIDWEAGQKIIDNNIEKVRIRSPLSCKIVRGVCQKCYGWDLGNNHPVRLGEAVGIVAAQAIGEPGTQLTMRTFHTGGVAGGGDITSGLPRIQEIFEVRIPKGKALISTTDGKVVEISPKKVIKIKSEDSKSKKEELLEYYIPLESAIWVKVGDKVEKGQQLCEGSLDLKKLFRLTNKKETLRYIIKEIQKVYVSQGVQIHDKHLEVIIRQMFSRVKVKSPGDTFLAPGEIIEKARLIEENLKSKEEFMGKNRKEKDFRPAKANQLLLGISKVSLTTDSFLSAASFQETSRVLIKAATEGKEDKLLGLKENVIIGKLIPAGAGFKMKK